MHHVGFGGSGRGSGRGSRRRGGVGSLVGPLVFGGVFGGVLGGEGAADKEEREGRCTLTKEIQERILRRPS
jgi:hypothetical protein